MRRHAEETGRRLSRRRPVPAPVPPTDEERSPIVTRMLIGLLAALLLSGEAAREILDTAKEALRLKDNIPLERIFDFSLAADAGR